MENIIIIATILILVALAAGYIIKAKKRGQKCIGCPTSRNCSGSCDSCSGCGRF